MIASLDCCDKATHAHTHFYFDSDEASVWVVCRRKVGSKCYCFCAIKTPNKIVRTFVAKRLTLLLVIKATTNTNLHCREALK